MDLMVTITATSEAPIDEQLVDALLDAIPASAGAALGIVDHAVELTVTGYGQSIGAAVDDAVAAAAAGLAGFELRGLAVEPYEGVLEDVVEGTSV